MMQKGSFPLVTASDCQDIWQDVVTITNRMQCVGGDALVSVCSGDSGGPLVVMDNGPSSEPLHGPTADAAPHTQELTPRSQPSEPGSIPSSLKMIILKS